MKKVIGLLFIVILNAGFMSCSEGQAKQDSTTSTAKLEVLYFHGTYRCETCNAVENNTEKFIIEDYKKQLSEGIIKFGAYNLDDKENKALVEKYQISFSTLLLVKSDGTVTDFTNTAFQYAHTDPEKYAELLKTEIDKQLAD
jgi:hypothetical protein